MSFLKRWLDRKSSGTKQVPPDESHVSPGDVITRALKAAGLMKNTRDPIRDVSARRRDETAATWKPDGSNHNNVADHLNAVDSDGVGKFLSASCGMGHNRLDYKLYVPSKYSAAAAPAPLIVMLHGCTQDPDDFAVGTQMNLLAEQHVFLVAYPQQTVRANTAKCWNWFRPEDQRRDSGEPKQIADATRQIIDKYQVDPDRVYVAGLSAGAAMAVIMGRTYPDLFHAVGAHSGLAYRSATNVISALSVMKAARTSTAAAQKSASTPMIIFHGDNDRTVDESNSAALLEQTVENWPESDALHLEPTQIVTSNGRTSKRIVYRRSNGASAIEMWRIGGGGHFWSGGNIRGSHTDPTGPNASEQLVRFFNQTRVS